MKRVIAALLLLVAVYVGAQASTLPSLEIVSHSGSPLMINIDITDPDQLVRSVTVETTLSSSLFRIPDDPERETISLSVSPFVSPGVYELDIVMDVELDNDLLRIRESAQIGFVDFVFGRDNMRFGNNADYESVIGGYGEVLMEWTNERFGEVGEIELVPLIDFMFSVFGLRSGRCYAFAGTEVQHWLYPELLPSYYDATYDLRPGVARVQREMNYLQLDMAFDHFIEGGHPLHIDPDASPEDRVDEILDEVSEIIEVVRSGRPAVAGFMGPQLHHAMVVFGYIVRPDSSSLDLLVANNWKSEQNVNVHTRNAEIVRVYSEPDEDGPRFDWIYNDGTRSREIDRLFRVPVAKEFEHDRETLDGLLSQLHGRLVHENRAVLVVEDASQVWITDGESKTGYERRRTYEELEGVVYDRVSSSHRFEYPADANLWLEIEDDEEVMVFAYRPPNASRPEIAWIEPIPVPEETEDQLRRVHLDTADLSWEVVVEPEENEG